MGFKSKIISGFINLGMKFMSEKSLKSVVFLGCSAKKVAPFIIMPATNFVKKQIINHFKEKPKDHGDVTTGKYEDQKISLISSGVGCPSAAIKLEALTDMDISSIIRFDFCGSLIPEVGISDIVIADKAICGDGTSPHYWNFEKEKIVDCDKGLLELLSIKLKENDMEFHVGPIWTTDALFKETPDMIKKATDLGAISIDMETSILYTYGKKYNIPVVSIMIVTDQPFKNKEGFSIPKINSRIIDNLQKTAKLILELSLS